MTEAGSRVIIDKLLSEVGWILIDSDRNRNVDFEVTNEAGRLDYLLRDSNGFPLCILEAKSELNDPLDGKEQARRYADQEGCRFIILSNGFHHYFWDLEKGSPISILTFPTQEYLELRKDNFSPPIDDDEEIKEDYIALTQHPNYDLDPNYINTSKRDDFLSRNKIKLLRDYQLKAVQAVKSSIKMGNERFLLEMATGTGKTLISSALIKMFLRLYNVKRVLFLVDRIELETQAQKEFHEVLKNDYRTVIWKANQSNWKSAEIVVSTVQSFVTKNKYKRIFRPDDFDLVISDEAHRSLGAKSRKVFEFFVGFKLGLTATPRDYLRAVDIDKLGGKDPRQLERRYMLDTYTIFGCKNSEPTYRYSLSDGVKDGYLINPKVIDARTEITTDLLSEKGYLFQTVDEDGNDVEEMFKQKDYEKKFFSEHTNQIFCETFLKNSKKDPYTNEIGKTLIFCVSQKHATRITQILNVLADKIYPNQYRSDFAVQVTSSIPNSQGMTTDFRNNKLNGHSPINQNYRTSKTRVCVTVGMMTTGYDCTDILNICMMRPIFSPSEFIQMKGRGTRKNDFKFHWISKDEIPQFVESEKDEFILFDFFGNYEYFEKDFDYDEIIKLPSKPSIPPDTPPPTPIDEAVYTGVDPLKFLEEIKIPDEGMRIDRVLYNSFKDVVTSNKEILEFVKQMDFKGAEKYLVDNILDKPEEYFTLDKLRRSIGLDRKLTTEELLLYIFDHIESIKTKNECLEEEFDKLDNSLKPDESVFNDAKQFFQSYTSDSEYREIINNKRFADLNVHPSGDAFKNLTPELRENIPSYINKNVDLEIFENVG